MIVIAGRKVLTLEGREITLQPGVFVYVPANTPSAFLCKNEQCCQTCPYSSEKVLQNLHIYLYIEILLCHPIEINLRILDLQGKPRDVSYSPAY